METGRTVALHILNILVLEGGVHFITITYNLEIFEDIQVYFIDDVHFHPIGLRMSSHFLFTV